MNDILVNMEPVACSNVESLEKYRVGGRVLKDQPFDIVTKRAKNLMGPVFKSSVGQTFLKGRNDNTPLK